MAADKRSTEHIKKRPSSAPKSGEMTNIPQIVLNERKEPTALNASSPVTTSSEPPSIKYHVAVDRSPSPRQPSEERHSSPHHNPVRSSSDIGLPATSMPNLALRSEAGAEGGGEGGGGDTHLGVYCSPRTSRRSVDMDINSREETRGQYEWIETLDSSSNSLKVLTASSRVGSALSLNSEYTARSIGLLSNDSDSDDLSLSEKEKLHHEREGREGRDGSGGKTSDKPAQLRRYMSYPEESQAPEVNARPSQSLINLKSADVNAATESRCLPDQSLDSSLTSCQLEGGEPDSQSENASSLDIKSSDASWAVSNRQNGNSEGVTTSKENSEGVGSKEGVGDEETGEASGGRGVERGGGVGSGGSGGKTKKEHKPSKIPSPVGVLPEEQQNPPGVTGRESSMLCYKCDTHDQARDGRIRQWLQDMAKHGYMD